MTEREPNALAIRKDLRPTFAGTIRRDSIRLALMGATAVAIGFAINGMRSRPLSLFYVPPSSRVALEAQVANQSTITLISLDELEALMSRKDVLLLDVRPNLFFEVGHIPNALSLPKEDFPEAFRKAERQLRSADVGRIVIYCSGGDCEDSAFVARELARVEIGPLSIFEGGWEEWERHSKGGR